MIDRRSLMATGLAAAGSALAAGGAQAQAATAFDGAWHAAVRRHARRVVEALSAQQRARAMRRRAAPVGERAPETPVSLAGLAEEIAADFRNGAVLKVKGCWMSETEVAWCLGIDGDDAST
jgi:hypothetical protein